MWRFLNNVRTVTVSFANRNGLFVGALACQRTEEHKGFIAHLGAGKSLASGQRMLLGNDCNEWFGKQWFDFEAFDGAAVAEKANVRVLSSSPSITPEVWNSRNCRFTLGNCAR